MTKLPQAFPRNFPATTGEQQCQRCAGWITGGIWMSDYIHLINQIQGPYCGNCASILNKERQP